MKHEAIKLIINCDVGPVLRCLAWAALKTERGQTIRQTRINEMLRQGETS